jgi:hypothetical protein
MRLDRAIDRYIGELARAGRQPSTRSYERYLFKLVDQVRARQPDVDARDVTADDFRTFRDRWG